MAYAFTKLSDADLKAFVSDDRADYYIERWKPDKTTRKIRTGWNWAAAFLGPIWLIYRRMYEIAGILLGVVLLELLFHDYLFNYYLDIPEIAETVEFLFGIAYFVACGAYGNYWYFRRAEKTILRVRQRGLPEDQHNTQLAEYGGTNLRGALAVFTSCAVLYGLGMYLAG